MTGSFSNPREVVLQLGLRSGMKVGDFGAGSGHYTHAIAAAVEPDGRAYAVDIQEDVLKHLKLNAHERHAHAIETIWGDVEKPGGTKLRDATLDAAVVANTLFQAEDKRGLVAEVKRTVKPGGKVLVVDWAGSYGGMGPHASQVVTEHAAEELFIGGGFHKAKSFRAGPHHYGIVFTRP